MFEQVMTQDLYGNKSLIPLFGEKMLSFVTVLQSLDRIPLHFCIGISSVYNLFLCLSDMALNIEGLLDAVPERERDAERKQVKKNLFYPQFLIPCNTLPQCCVSS